MVLINLLLFIIYFILFKSSNFRTPGCLLLISSCAYVIVNAIYGIINWSNYPPVRITAIKLGKIIIISQVLLGITGSISLFFGMVILIKKIIKLDKQIAEEKE
jgi:hypothetical protein